MCAVAQGGGLHFQGLVFFNFLNFWIQTFENFWSCCSFIQQSLMPSLQVLFLNLTTKKHCTGFISLPVFFFFYVYHLRVSTVYPPPWAPPYLCRHHTDIFFQFHFAQRYVLASVFPFCGRLCARYLDQVDMLLQRASLPFFPP